MEEGEAEKKVVGYDKSKKSINFSIPANPWMFSTFILGIAVIVLVIIMVRGGVSGNAVATNNIAVAPTQNNPTNAANQAAAPQNIPKSDKPKAEAFVFSYCPYGLQFEKALSPVYNLLKNKADIKIVFIGAMHGEYEHIESLRQLCIQKLYSTDKLWSYLNEFTVNTELGKCKGEVSCISPFIEKIFSNNGIDKSKIESCMKNDAETIYNQDMARAKELGISGSPTFVMNNVKASVSRSPESIKTAVCNAFNSAPKECDTKLSTTAAGAGFGTTTSSASSSCG